MIRVLAICICLLAAIPGHAGSPSPAPSFAQSLSEADAARVAGRWADAVTLSKKALFIQPEHADARFHLAQALLETSRYYEARRHFRLALQARVQDRAVVDVPSIGLVQIVAANRARFVEEEPDADTFYSQSGCGDLRDDPENVAKRPGLGYSLACEAERDRFVGLPGIGFTRDGLGGIAHTATLQLGRVACAADARVV